MDPRALALYRMGLAGVILLDLALRLPDFHFFLSSQGPLPLSAIAVDTHFGKFAFSLYSMSSYAAWPYLLYSLTALGALSLLLGRRCGLVTPVLCVLMLSMQNRTGVATDFGDRLILVGLFFGMFLPWDRAYVYRQAPLPSGALRHPAAWSLGLVTLGMCQVAFLRFFLAAPTPLSIALALAPVVTLLAGSRLRAGVLFVFALLLALTWIPFEVGLTPLVVAVGLLLWVPFGTQTEPKSSAGQIVTPHPPIGLLALAVFVVATSSLMTMLPRGQQSESLRRLADFLALSPERGQAFPPRRQQHFQYRAVALDSQGERRALGQSVQLDSDYRRRLYLQSLDDDTNWGLRYWLAYWYFYQEEQRLASKYPWQVELYREGADGRQQLVARWPMTPLRRGQAP